MNILYITHCDPRATDSGSAQRSHYLWNVLKRIGTVYTVFNVGAKAPVTYDEGDRICSASFAPDGYFSLRLDAGINRIFSPFVWPFRNRRILRRKMPWKGVVFDLVVVRYLGHVALTNAWMFGDVYVDIDDLPSESFSTIRRNRLLPPLGWLGSKLVSWWQRYILSKCKAAWIANSDQMPVVAPMCRCEALPNLPMPLSGGYKVNGRQKHQIMTVGLMSYEPNYEGVDWFLDEVWDKILEKFPEVTFTIAGHNIPDSLKHITIPNVMVEEDVPDANEFMLSHDIMVVPLLSGSGVRVKIIEAMALGKTVITTTVGAEGIDAINGVQLLIANTPDEFVTALDKCIKTPDLCKIIGENAREFIQLHHNLEVISRQIIEFFEALSSHTC